MVQQFNASAAEWSRAADDFRDQAKHNPQSARFLLREAARCDRKAALYHEISRRPEEPFTREIFAWFATR